MNGGNKQYIGRDGFMDVYNATPTEEKEWAQEVIANALTKIDTVADSTSLKFAVENLVFHQYKGLEALLKIKLKDAGPIRQIIFANILWTVFKYPQSFEIIHGNFIAHRKECLNEVFHALNDFKRYEAAVKFIDECLASDDAELVSKAGVSKGMWPYLP